jgi:hypothetical protein
MPRTEITVQNVSKAGLAPTYAAADAANDMMFKNDGHTVLHVKNGGAGAISVTVVSIADPYGRLGDVVVSVPAAGERIIGVFKDFLFNQKPGSTNAGKIHVDFDVDTSVTVAALKIPKE